MRARQDGLQDGAHAGLEPAFGGPHVVERHQAREIGIGERPAIGLAGKPLGDLPGAGPFGLDRRRPAGEDPLPARGLGDALRVQGTADGQVSQVGQDNEPRPDAEADAGVGPAEGLLEVGVGPVLLPDERRRDPTLARADEDGVGELVPVRPEVRVAAQLLHRNQGDPLPVDGDVHLGEALMVPCPERHLEDVFAVGGEMVIDHDAAAGAVGRALHMVPLVLGLVGRDEVGLGVRGRARVAQDQAADVVGGVQVRVQERGRQRLRYGHVVEVPQIEIRGKPLAGVDGEAEEVLDGLPRTPRG